MYSRLTDSWMLWYMCLWTGWASSLPPMRCLARTDRTLYPRPGEWKLWDLNRDRPHWIPTWNRLLLQTFNTDLIFFLLSLSSWMSINLNPALYSVYDLDLTRSQSLNPSSQACTWGSNRSTIDPSPDDQKPIDRRTSFDLSAYPCGLSDNDHLHPCPRLSRQSRSAFSS